MAMAYVREIERALRGKGIGQDILAFIGGVADGIMIEKFPLGYFIKNIGIPVASFFVPVPEGIKYQCEGALGLLVTLLMMKK